MRVRLAVFDLDGTLIDSIGDIADAMNAVLGELGHPVHPRDDYRFMVGDGLGILARRALPADLVDVARVDDLVRRTRQEYSTRWTRTTRPYPGISELLAELGSRDIQRAVLSNKPDFATQAIVAELFRVDDFSDVRGAADGVPLKPDPTLVSEIISTAGVAPPNAVMVGDTGIDMATGRNAGMLTVGVTWGTRDTDELLEHGADHIIDHPLELLPILG
jgi:phosphoglycolate phosphatase